MSNHLRPCLLATVLSMTFLGCAPDLAPEVATTGEEELNTCAEPGEQSVSGPSLQSCALLSRAYFERLTPAAGGLYAFEGTTLVHITPGQTERLATFVSPIGLAVDASRAYVLSNGGRDHDYELVAVDLQTKATTTLSQTRKGSAWIHVAEPGPMVISDGTLFWSECGGGASRSALGSIKSLALDALDAPGAEPSVVATRVSCARSIAVDDAHVYYTVNEQVMRVARGGGQSEVFASTHGDGEGTPEPAAVVVSGGTVYWSDSKMGWIYRAPATDGSARERFVNAWPRRLSVGEDGHLYWTNGLGVSRRALDGSSAAEAVVRGNTSSDVAVFGSNLYWTGYRGTFVRSLDEL
ncbi:MAG: hypothetical protein BGO98_44195 [Myxococcales bacterium 68-20]|nr:hypothetical protein [Myxococcales bacterium]OJY26927.1 MAG: hypothetical protein BGO98_44195 [Myxococcales bacterium 68-20]